MFLSCAVGQVVRTFELSSDAIQPLRSMASQSDRVSCARYNHNGRILASGSTDGGICLDIAGSGELLSRFFYPSASPRDRGVTSVHFSSGSRFLATGGSDGFVRVWDLKTQEVTQVYSVSASAVTCVSFSGYKDERIVAGSASGVISVCDVQSSETAGFLTIDPNHGVHQVSALQASPHPYARQALGACYSDGSVRVWDLTTGQLTSAFMRHHEAAATSLAISPVSKVLLASAGLDGRIAFFDTLQRKELRAIHLDQPISALSLCADGKTLAAGTIAGEILVYDLRGAITPLYSTVALDGAAVNSLHFAPPPTDTATSVSPQGQRVVSAEHMSPVKGETVQEIALRKLQALGLGGDSPSRPASLTAVMHQSQPAPVPSHTREAAQPDSRSDGSRLIARSRSEPSLVALFASPSRVQPPVDTMQPSSPASTTVRVERQVLMSPAANGLGGNSGNPLRAEIERMRGEVESRHRRDQEQLSGMLDVLMDRYEALEDENRRLRLENERLKEHLLANQ